MKLVRTAAVLLLLAPSLYAVGGMHVVGRGIEPTSCDGGVKARQLCEGATCKTLTFPFASLTQSRASLDLPAGRWEVTSQSSRCWAPAVTVDAAVANTIPVWPSAAIHGTIDPANGDISVPLRAELRLTGEGDEQKAPRFSTDCPIANGRWSCHVPATGFHLRLSLDRLTPRYAPWYARGVSVNAGEEKDFGMIRFEPGASVAGTIATPRGRNEQTVVELTATSSSSLSSAQKSNPLRVVVKGSSGGLFQFTGVPHGTYRLSASRPGWLPAEVKSVRVDEGRESFLEKPLQLTRAAVVDVFITPPLSTEEEPWHVRLEISADVAPSKPVAESAAAVSGEWRNDTLRAGKYVLSVTDREGNVFRRETVEATVDGAPQFLKILKVHVLGVVKLGSAPVESELVFSDDESSASITLQADAAGKFEGILSHGGRWLVQVHNTAKKFYVKDVPVEVKRASEQAVAEVVVALPGGKVKGRVTNKAGDPARADVVVIRGSSLIGNGATMPDGSFELEGIEPGPVSLVAMARGAESDTVSYLAAEDDPATAQLLLQELTEVKCQLLAEDGYPIAGAIIRYSAAGMTRRRQAISDPSGEFSIRIPQDTRSLLAAIVVEGFPVAVRQLDPEGGERQRIILSTASASLHVVMPPGGGSWPFITFDGQAFLSITALMGLGGNRGVVGDGIQIPVEPGIYTICSARGDSACQTARVAAGHDQTIIMDGAKTK